jgi:hypothetical protein
MSSNYFPTSAEDYQVRQSPQSKGNGDGYGLLCKEGAGSRAIYVGPYRIKPGWSLEKPSH